MKFNPKSILKKFSRKQLLIGGGAAALVLLIIVKNVGGGKENTGGQSKLPPLAVQVAKVVRQRVEQTVSAAGKIRPVFETEISSTVSAQIKDIRVVEGDEVSVGDTLVILDRLRYEAAYDRAQSALRSARARLKQVKAERDRSKQLYEKSLISLQEMEVLEASYEGAVSQREQAQASANQAKDDLAKTVLLAPESGVVTKINKEIGEMALGSTFQADVLLIISDLSSMEVVVEVDETDVVDIELLDMVEVEVDALPDDSFSGRVSQIAHSATVLGQGTQEQATNFEVEVTLDVKEGEKRIDPRLRPGMSATATITTGVTTEAIAVPIQALTARPPKKEPAKGEDDNELAMASDGPPEDRPRKDRENDARSGNRQGGRDAADGERVEPVEVVFVVQKDSVNSGGFFGLFGGKKKETAVQREVTLGISSDTHYEIVAGLEAGEEIVTGNYRAVSRDLKDGRRIERRKRPEGGGPNRGR